MVSFVTTISLTTFSLLESAGSPALLPAFEPLSLALSAFARANYTTHHTCRKDFDGTGLSVSLCKEGDMKMEQRAASRAGEESDKDVDKLSRPAVILLHTSAPQTLVAEEWRGRGANGLGQQSERPLRLVPSASGGGLTT